MRRYWIISWKKLELSIVYRSNAYLLNELLQDWLYIIQHYIHDFTYIRWFSQSWLQNMGIGKWLGGLTNLESWSLKCKINFQCNEIWRKAQSKKMMRYSYKQNFCVSWMDVGRQSKKWANGVLNRESGTTPYWREFVHIAASITLMRNPNPYPWISTNSNLFQPIPEKSTGCPNDAAMCKFVKKSQTGLNEGLSPYSIGKLKGPPSFTNFDESKYLTWYLVVEVCPRTN